MNAKALTLFVETKGDLKIVQNCACVRKQNKKSRENHATK